MTAPVVHLVSQQHDAQRQWHRCASACTIISAAFVLAVLGVMTLSFLRDVRSNPLADGRLASLKAQLSQEAENAALKEQVRELDLAIRQTFFERRAFLLHGGWLALAGSMMLVICSRTVARLEHRTFVPKLAATRPNPALANAVGRRAVLIGGMSMAGMLVALAAMPRLNFQFEPVATAPAAAQPAEAVDPALQWGGFRGNDGRGIAAAGEHPKHWDGAAGHAVLWRTLLPLDGNNSPVVWGNQIFLSGASATQREVYAFDARDGRLLWHTAVPITGATPKLSDGTSFAPSTLAADERHVYAVFPTGDVVCLDHQGKKVWSRTLGPPQNAYGHASSPRAYGGNVILQWDQGASADAGGSSLLALDGITGQIKWQTPRPVKNSWATPLLLPIARGIRVVCSGNPWIMAYDAPSGKELWRVKGLGGDVAPSPAAEGETIFVCQDSADGLALRPDGSVAWKYSDDLPDISSPLVANGLIWFCKTGGSFTCLDASTGKPVYQESLDGEFNASPAMAGDIIYMLDAKGTMYLVNAVRTFGIVGKCALGEEARGSPAFADGKIFIRGQKNLYCIGGKP